MLECKNTIIAQSSKKKDVRKNEEAKERKD